MSKKQAIAKGLRVATKQAEQNCDNCRWFIKKSTEAGQCNQFNIEVKTEQVCNVWGEGYDGKYNKNLIREYKQQLAHSREYTKHAEPFSPWPTQEDIDSHFITRYFVRYGSNLRNPIIEVSEDNFKIVSDEFYHKMELEWKINGPPLTVVDEENRILDKGISEANRDTIILKDREMVGLRQYLTDLTELAFVKDGSKEIGDKTSVQTPKKKSVYGSGGRRERPKSSR